MGGGVFGACGVVVHESQPLEAIVGGSEDSDPKGGYASETSGELDAVDVAGDGAVGMRTRPGSEAAQAPAAHPRALRHLPERVP